jgi:hypothetical protein
LSACCSGHCTCTSDFAALVEPCTRIIWLRFICLTYKPCAPPGCHQGFVRSPGAPCRVFPASHTVTCILAALCEACAYKQVFSTGSCTAPICAQHQAYMTLHKPVVCCCCRHYQARPAGQILSQLPSPSCSSCYLRCCQLWVVGGRTRFSCWGLVKVPV